MSISQRLYRIARQKLSELKEWLDNVEAEQANTPRDDKELAENELNEAITPPAPQKRPTPSAASSRPAQSPASSALTDPLYYHYRLLGLQPGADLAAVQSAYKRYAERANPARFPPGSEEEATAREIRKKLDTSYRILCEALDPTLRRFELLEFDSSPPKE